MIVSSSSSRERHPRIDEALHRQVQLTPEESGGAADQGGDPVRLPRTEIDRFEGRLEYWDAATRDRRICEPTTPYHERPSRVFTRLAELIARLRGSPTESYGSMDLLLHTIRT